MARGQEEIWFTVSKTGQERAWRWSHSAFRAVPVAKAKAEMMLATGAARRTMKPEWVGR